MTRPIQTKTSRHGRHFETGDREILIVSRRYPGETLLWAHVRPKNSTQDFTSIKMDPHGGPGSLDRALKDALDYPLDSMEVLLATLEEESHSGTAPRHTSGTHANGQFCTEVCFDV